MVPIEDKNTKMDFFSDLYHNTLKELTEPLRDALETLMLVAYTEIFKRNIIILTTTSYYHIGKSYFRSPLLLLVRGGEILYTGFKG